MSTRDTEFICEVVRISSVEPHPNADRLEVARFETLEGPSAYTCVIGKDQFKVGDLAGYVGVDSVVPLVGPMSARWEFLTKRQDGKGKDRFRVRAARIRGLYSEGILAELDDAQPQDLGDQLDFEWGITYHEVKRPGGNTSDLGQGKATKVKDHTLGGLFPIYGVDSLRKVPFLFREGEDVVYTEKIHGTNFRAGLLGIGVFGAQRFVLGSHRVVKAVGGGWFRRLWRTYVAPLFGAPPSGWYGEDVWGDAALALDLEGRMRAQGVHCENTVLYGELYGLTKTGARIQDLTYGAPTLALRLFDAYDAETGSWLTWPELKHLAQRLDLPVVPELPGPGEYVEMYTRAIAEGTSTLDPGGTIREGVVVRGRLDARRGKWVSEGYRMREGG